jgi:putative methionine-R-sulfoxide reductase with GAF domain
MLKQTGHKLAVGSQSIVGQSTGRGEPVVVNDVMQEANYYPNPLLPNTRAELAIPLKIGSKVFGALDVQSDQVNAFSQEDINILQVLADQLTVTVQNADLFTKTQQTLQRHRLLHQMSSAAGLNPTVEDAIRNSVQTLHQIMPKEHITYFSLGENGAVRISSYTGYSPVDKLKTIFQPGEGVIGKALVDQKPFRVDDTNTFENAIPLLNDSLSMLVVPVQYGNQIIGIIDVESTSIAAFDESDQEIITTLANNLASIISNISLLDQIRLQIERQQQLYEITNKIRRSVDIETIMKTSVSEICTALNISRASIELNPPLETGAQKTIVDSEREQR